MFVTGRTMPFALTQCNSHPYRPCKWRVIRCARHAWAQKNRNIISNSELNIRTDVRKDIPTRSASAYSRCCGRIGNEYGSADALVGDISATVDGKTETVSERITHFQVERDKHQIRANVRARSN